MGFELRKWQKEALELYRKSNKSVFSVTATPGGGKTTMALTLADKLMQAKQITTIIVVVPTDHLRTQWSDNAVEMGLFLDPSLSNEVKSIPPDFNGYVATYAQIASKPALHRSRAVGDRQKTLVIFDEIHHAGDGYSWGEGLRTAFEDVSRKLLLTGTPFRTGSEEIPFIEYTRDADGTLISKSDYTYGYAEALADNVVRPVSFAAYSGETSWSNSAGQILSAKMGDVSISKEYEKAAWKTALNPKGQWIRHVIKAADDRLTEVRSSGMPNAGAMILAPDKEHAREYAKLVKKISGTEPTVILSDDRRASQKITDFSNSTDLDDRWLVAVKMVSEGVDVPRLAVGVWATTCKTALFFAQAVGRFVRCKRVGETATVFLPAVRMLLALAANLEEQRSHVIPPPEQSEDSEEDHELIDPMFEEEEDEPGERNKNEALSAEAEFAHVLFGGQAFDGRTITEDDVAFIGIPGILDPKEIASLLQKRDAEIRKNLGIPNEREEPKEVVLNPIEAEKAKKEIRKDINRFVSRIALSKGLPHAQVHARTRKAVAGPPTAVADVEILNQRLEWLQSQ